MFWANPFQTTSHFIIFSSYLPYHSQNYLNPRQKNCPLTIIIITNLTTIIITGSDYETLIRYSEPDKEILRTEFSITVIVKVVKTIALATMLMVMTKFKLGFFSNADDLKHVFRPFDKMAQQIRDSRSFSRPFCILNDPDPISNLI